MSGWGRAQGAGDLRDLKAGGGSGGGQGAGRGRAGDGRPQLTAPPRPVLLTVPAPRRSGRPRSVRERRCAERSSTRDVEAKPKSSASERAPRGRGRAARGTAGIGSRPGAGEGTRGGAGAGRGVLWRPSAGAWGRVRSGQGPDASRGCEVTAPEDPSDQWPDPAGRGPQSQQVLGTVGTRTPGTVRTGRRSCPSLYCHKGSRVRPETPGTRVTASRPGISIPGWERPRSPESWCPGRRFAQT